MTQTLPRGALAAALLGAAPAFAADTAPMTSNALILKPLTLTKLERSRLRDDHPERSRRIVTIDADTGARTSTTRRCSCRPTPAYRARFASSGLNNDARRRSS